MDDCHPAMLKHWVEQATPTWSSLVEALESTVMGRSDIASEIKTQHKVVKKESTSRGKYYIRSEHYRNQVIPNHFWVCQMIKTVFSFLYPVLTKVLNVQCIHVQVASL